MQTYLDWYLSGRLAPYLRSHRVQPGTLSVIEAVQPPGDMSDPATDDLSIVQNTTAGIGASVDFGAGRFRDRIGVGATGLVAPGVPTSIFVDDWHRIRVFSIPRTRIAPLLEAEISNGDPFDLGSLSAGMAYDRQFTSVLDLIWQRCASEAAFGRLFAEAAAVLIASEILRMRVPAQGPHLRAGGLAPRALKRVLDHIEETLADDVSLSELAAVAGLSQSHFCRAFHKSVGLPPHRYRFQRRMQHAQEVLLVSHLTVTEVAVAVGYDDPGRFATAFRRHAGLPPSVWRREQTR